MKTSVYTPRLTKGGAPSVTDIIRVIHLAADDVVIDFGCGAGRLTIPIAEKLRDLNGDGVVIACDFSKILVRQLTKTVESGELQRRVRPVCLSDIKAFHLPVPPSGTDCVLAVNSLHYLKKPLPYLREINRVLKPTGELILAEWKRPADRFVPSRSQRFIHPEALHAVLKEARLAVRESIRIDGFSWALRITKTALVKRKTPISIIPISFPKLSYS